MRKLLFIYAALTAILVVSCDKRKDLFKDENTAAVMSIQLQNSHSPWSSTTSGNYTRDTLKVGTNYSFMLLVTDEASELELIFEGNGSLTVDGQPFVHGTITGGNHVVVWSPDTTGLRSFELKVVDVYDVATSYNFDIFVFVNWVPHIDWTIVDVNQLDPYEKKIIVDGQDQDQLYGGNIIYYQYIIDSDTTNYPWNSMNYIFPGPGSYDIGVRAMDSNYEWSNMVFISDVVIN